MHQITAQPVQKMTMVFQTFFRLKQYFSEFHKAANRNLDDEKTTGAVSISELSDDGLSFTFSSIGKKFTLRMAAEADPDKPMRGVLYCLRHDSMDPNRYVIQEKFQFNRDGQFDVVRTDEPEIKLYTHDAWVFVYHLIHSALPFPAIESSAAA